VIRWPQDALIFSVRVRGCGAYAAGYVEGDITSPEILGARQTPEGAELISLRVVRDAYAFEEGIGLRALRALNGEGIAPVLDLFVAHGALQPMTQGNYALKQIVVAERLPGDVHLADLARALFRRSNGGARPPVGLALALVRDIARVYARTPSTPLPRPDLAPRLLRLTRRADNVLLAWDGSVHVQPRVFWLPSDDDIVAVVPGAGAPLDEAVRACGHHLVRLLSGEIPDVNRFDRNEADEIDALVDQRGNRLPRDVPAPVQDLVRATLGFRSVRDRPPHITLAELIERLDALLVDEPFSQSDVAGVLAQTFADERAQDLAFREDLAACDLDALTLPDVPATDVEEML
jgi:hypothetical protein